MNTDLYHAAFRPTRRQFLGRATAALTHIAAATRASMQLEQQRLRVNTIAAHGLRAQNQVMPILAEPTGC